MVLEVVAVLGGTFKSGGVTKLPVGLSEVGLDCYKLRVPLLLHNFIVKFLLKVRILALIPQLEVRSLHLLCRFGTGLFGHVLAHLLFMLGGLLQMVGILLSLAPNLTVSTLS